MATPARQALSEPTVKLPDTLVDGEAFNAGCHNHRVREIAEIVGRIMIFTFMTWRRG